MRGRSEAEAKEVRSGMLDEGLCVKAQRVVVEAFLAMEQGGACFDRAAQIDGKNVRVRVGLTDWRPSRVIA